MSVLSAPTKGLIPKEIHMDVVTKVPPVVGLVIDVNGRRFQVAKVAARRGGGLSLAVRDVSGKAFAVKCQAGVITPSADQSWTLPDAPKTTDFALGQVVRFTAAAKGKSLIQDHVVIKVTDTAVNVVPLGGDSAHPQRYVIVKDTAMLVLVDGNKLASL